MAMWLTKTRHDCYQMAVGLDRNIYNLTYTSRYSYSYDQISIFVLLTLGSCKLLITHNFLKIWKFTSRLKVQKARLENLNSIDTKNGLFVLVPTSIIKKYLYLLENLGKYWGYRWNNVTITWLCFCQVEYAWRRDNFTGWKRKQSLTMGFTSCLLIPKPKNKIIIATTMKITFFCCTFWHFSQSLFFSTMDDFCSSKFNQIFRQTMQNTFDGQIFQSYGKWWGNPFRKIFFTPSLFVRFFPSQKLMTPPLFFSLT